MIVDHTCVDLYTNLTATDIARVKTMWVSVLGASHSLGYRVGCQLLQSNIDNRFQVNVIDSGPPEGYTTNHLRISRAVREFTYNSWVYGGNEAAWYTSPASVPGLEAHLSYCNTNGPELAAFGFGWSWQPTWHNPPGGGIDPVYQVRWAGGSEGGPDGDLRWGLDDNSFAVTSNHISMDTYLRATQAYIDSCRTNNYQTKVFFTTGPPDGDGGDGERAYQRHLKYEHIRNYVKATTDAILFDYADILCWSDSGEQATISWTDYGGTPCTVPEIHGDNYRNFDGTDGSGNPSHIGERGALRLGKALWYLLARMSEPYTPVEPPNVTIDRVSAGVVQLQFTAASNTTYTVQLSPDLSLSSWLAMTNIPSQPFDRQIQVADSTTNSQLFYRVSAQRSP